MLLLRQWKQQKPFVKVSAFYIFLALVVTPIFDTRCITRSLQEIRSHLLLLPSPTCRVPSSSHEFLTVSGSLVYLLSHRTEISAPPTVTSKEIVFLDGTTIPSDHVTIILCTGYTLLAPFLRDLHEGPITKTTTTLTTNGDYIRPLHHSIFALDSRLPRDALSFISLPWYIGNGPNTYIQGLFLGHSFASVDGEFLPTNEVGIKELIEREEAKRAEGFEPFDIGEYV